MTIQQSRIYNLALDEEEREELLQVLGLQQNSWVENWGDCWGSAPAPGIL